MKSFTGIALLAALLWASTAVAQNWQWQNPLPTGNWLSGLAFAGDSDGWIVGGSGTILRTRDGGASWTHQESGAGSNLYEVWFLDEWRGFAVGGESP